MSLNHPYQKGEEEEESQERVVEIQLASCDESIKKFAASRDLRDFFIMDGGAWHESRRSKTYFVVNY